ncbi:sulfur carrier protein ThiS [Corynebacterium sp. 320]|uniref:Sulfur carrier protein ThiS n=1 Tax=Corynebacterium zhongnanshanii TaxID=2768834 RepID=A0ABQ6VFF8_9CORY|nr:MULTISPECIES: sulfur carrier protein ThiS [Corynebacterium]KAB1504004.1 sulfur carrier protein ThiS [Corynebacterium sp. 320]KAB1552897.1 sulfur carrier protein ThiS [Corynebacterium sp. 321]KAB1553885.1 sulfur carrier protein ThiS [Corynebacterium sp. 319]KAB3523147.1 sulfur carrier protein ThiS [Corynebacterium zhongnanshanii]KAB3528140.1 sulfur carrier protein ThiS [Corynebacterium sp. 250]
MTITLNGESTTWPGGSVADLVQHVTGQEDSAGVAVALNGQVVPASQWDRAVSDGDSADILLAVQGG